MNEELLAKVKQNLIITHSEDDTYFTSLILASIAYAEDYQKKPEGYYSENAMRANTEQAVIMLTSHLYESRDGSTGGFYGDNVQAGQQAMDTINLLLRLNKDVIF